MSSCLCGRANVWEDCLWSKFSLSWLSTANPTPTYQIGGQDGPLCDADSSNFLCRGHLSGPLPQDTVEERGSISYLRRGWFPTPSTGASGKPKAPGADTMRLMSSKTGATRTGGSAMKMVGQKVIFALTLFAICP